MSKFIAVFKLLLKQQFRGAGAKTKSTDDYGKPKKKGKIGTILLVLLICCGLLPVAAMIVSIAYFMGLGFNLCEIDVTSVIAFVYLIVQGIILLFGLPLIINNVLSPKDGEKLLYMPIPKNTIFAAKMALVYMSELLTALVATILALVPFGIGAGLGVSYYILLVVALFFVPALPLALSAIIAGVVSTLFKKLFKNKIFKTIFSLLVFGAIFGGYMYVMFMVGFTLETVVPDGGANADWVAVIAPVLTSLNEAISGVVVYALPNMLFAKAMIATSALVAIGDTLLSIAINIALIAVAILIAGRIFSYSIMLEQETGSGKKIKVDLNDKRYKAKSVIPMLVTTSYKRYVRDSRVGMNILMAIIMPIFLIVIFGFSFNAEGGAGEIFASPIYQFIAPLALLGYFALLCTATNVMAIYPFSMDKESIYIYKIIPVPFSKILLSKIIIALVPLAFSSIVVSVMAVAMLGINWYFAVLLCIALAAMQFGSMCITALLDLRKPNFNWDKANGGLKATKNALITMLISLIIAVITAGTAILFFMWFNNGGGIFSAIVMWLVLIAVGSVFALLAFRNIATHGEKTLQNMEI